MKKMLLKLFGCALGACIAGFVLLSTPAYAADTTVAVDATNFPDANFRSWVEANYDTDSSGYLDDSSLTATAIDVYNLGIADLTGIAHFPVLESLTCNSNQLTSLDITQNPALEQLNCASNQLTSLDVTQNPALEQLNCASNQLTSLDVTQNPALEDLYCTYNQLASLDVTQNLALVYLYCYGNQLTSLDVTQNHVLKHLLCLYNQLTYLDVTQNPALASLGCDNNQLTSLDVTQNPALVNFTCNNNQLTSLDVTQNPALASLGCSGNQLYDITGVTGSIGSSSWYADSQSLTVPVVADPLNPGSYVSIATYPGSYISLSTGASRDMSTSRFTASALGIPYSFTTHITGSSRTVSGTVTFTLGAVNDTAIAVDAVNFPDANFRNWVSGNFDLDSSGYLDDSSLTATAINVSNLGIADLAGIEHFPALLALYCYNNQLTALDVSQNPALKELSCSNNQLTALDVTQSPALTSLSCGNNQLGTLNLSQSLLLVSLNCYDNQLTSLDVTQNHALKYLDCYGNQLISLDITQNPELVSLYCTSNQLSSIDVTQNPTLTSLSCFTNQLTSLDITQNPLLYSLECGSNQLTSLDLSQNPLLYSLGFSGNQLSSLDLSNNTALSALWCGSNQLYDIIGVSASVGSYTWSAQSQALTVPVVADPLNPGSYVSVAAYPLDSGHSIALDTGAGHDPATSKLTADALNTPYGFTTTINSAPLTGTITFVLDTTTPTHTVTFVDWDGTTLSIQTVASGSGATAPTAPTRAGHTFTGWDAAFSSVTSDLTVTAQYSVNIYTVAFVDWDGTLLSSQQVASGANATAPAAPTRVGHTFTGWDISFTNVTSDLTVTAQYGAATHTVTFVDWDGTVLSTQSVAYGSGATAPAAPARAGHTFTGWDAAFSSVTSDITVTAQYAVDAPLPGMLQGAAGSIGSALGGGLVMDVRGSSDAAGTSMILWPGHGQANQRFTLVPDGQGYYWIVSISSGMALDAYGAAAAAGTPIVQWPRHDGDNQKWKIIDLGGGEFLIASKMDGGMCIDVANAQASGGAALVLWPVHSGANQRFTLDVPPAAPAAPAPSQGVVLRSPLRTSILGPHLVADVHSASQSDAAPAIAWPSSGQANQRFTLQLDAASGYYVIKTYSGAIGKALDVSGGRAAAGDAVVQWPEHGGLNQRWYLEDAGDGYVYVRSAINGYALDIKGAGGQGSQLIVWPFHGGANQKWALDAA